jgi:alkylhydroperoxidase family enzyme
MKLAYAVTRRRFGKAVTPLKVVYARLPISFALFSSKISELDKKVSLSPEMVMLIREQVARINVCLFCIDIARSIVIKDSMNEAKFDALENYRESSIFSDAERAALDYVTELTVHKKVEPHTFARLRDHFSERQICELAWLVGTEHYYNMVNIGLDIHSDMLCDIRKKQRVESAVR